MQSSVECRSSNATCSLVAGETTQVVVMSSSPAVARPLASDGERMILEVVNYSVICGLLSLFGVVTNVLNMVVFVKIGFQESMNISLMGLAVSDLLSLVSMIFISICFNPLFANAPLPFSVDEIMYMVGGPPHVCFARITSLITAFITFERCLCIAVPLKVKRIITPGRTKAITLFFFILIFSVFSPFYYGNNLVWAFDTARNATMFKIVSRDNHVLLETITFITHGVVISTFSFVFTIFCTIVLAFKLTSKTKWRQATATRGDGSSEGRGLKDKRVVKMVAFISTMFIVCFLPATLLHFVMALEPNFRFGKTYHNVYMISWSVSFVTETVNSSFNFFVYLKMSSKFRTVFLKTFLNLEEKK
ncbi:probable G-protein coupled receptor 139 [Aplysia californica]|uniref:Probable G-protein coupled receptor 139 n=1 Tax=Aplysia californica TaxID=6500 RepID=A0ABM0JI99_APLCA|nr:probable G-protein coupled receptor 139 [Aplysia californica]